MPLCTKRGQPEKVAGTGRIALRVKLALTVVGHAVATLHTRLGSVIIFVAGWKLSETMLGKTLK